MVITKSDKNLRIELDKSEPSFLVLKAEHLGQSHYFTQKITTNQVEIPYPSEAFKSGEVQGYVFPLAKDNGEVSPQFYGDKVETEDPGWKETNISNGQVPPPGTWVEGKAKIAKARYFALKAKNKRLKKKKSRGGPAYPDLNVP